MKIVYMLGNGFDLAQGLKTRYSDFYHARLLNRPLKGDILQKLQVSVNADIASWADLEKRLGEFTSEMSGIEDLDSVYDFLREELRSYLQEEQQRKSIDTTKALQNRSILATPEAYLLPESRDAIQSTVKMLTSSNKTCEIDIISFNYTHVIERAFAYKGEAFSLGKVNGDMSVKINGIHKVHGSLEKEMVMGVADASQIANKELAANPDATDVIVKPNMTALRRDRLCAHCKHLISQADIIVMYGLSIGETDKNWWQHVTTRLQGNSNTRLLIYGHPKDSLNRLDYPRVRREEKALYRKLYECNGASNIQFTRLDKQIFISLDDSLFQGIL